MSVPDPLSFGQLSIWRSIETNPLVDGIRSQLTIVQPLPAGATEQQVRSAVDTLWRRHEGLRTTFELDGREPRQVVHPGADGVVEVRSLGTPAQLEPCAAELFARPFILTKEFGWQVRLMTVPDGTASVAISIHHILADRWAWRLLLAEFHRLLVEPAPARAALESPAPAPAALAREQRSDAWATRRSAARVYWKRLTEDFADIPASEAGAPGERLCGSLDLGGAIGVVSDIVDRHRVTAQTVLLSLFALGVSAMTGRDRLVVHLMVANRLRAEWRDLVTSMNQLVPAGVVVDEAGTFTDLLQHVQTTGLAAMRNGCFDVDDAAAISQRPPGSPVGHVLNYMVPAWPRTTDDLRQDGPSAPHIGPSTRPAIAGIYGVVTQRETPVFELHADSNLYPEDRLRKFLEGTGETLRLLSVRQDLRLSDLVALY